MASSSSFTVLLVLVALGGALVDAAGRPSRPLGWNNDGSMSKPNGDDLLRVTIPSALRQNASPLDGIKAAEYETLLQARALGGHSADRFCQDAKLACHVDINIAVRDPATVRDEAGPQKGATGATTYFNEKEITAKGSAIGLPGNVHDSYPSASFLPQSLAEKMPFTSARMPELLDSLNIPHGSNLAVLMARTVSQCELADQVTGKCVTSLEDMTSFVAARLPQATRIQALHRSSSISEEGVRTKDSWKVLGSTLYKSAVACRSVVFPYAVYECHDTNGNMRIYSVDMEGRDGARATGVAACHEGALEATADGKRKPAAAAAEACHWVTDSLIWAPAN